MVSIFTAFVMSFVMVGSVQVFAAEDPGLEIPEKPGVVDESIGDILYYGSIDFVNTGTISLYMNSGNWSADFLVCVTGNPGVRYQVNMTTPGGDTYTTYITSNGGLFTNMATLTYASSGLYTFKFTRLNGDAVTAHGRVEICD